MNRGNFERLDIYEQAAPAAWHRLPLTSNPHKEMAEDFSRSATYLSDEVLECSRKPLRVLNQNSQYAIHEARLHRCRAFGQHLQRLSQDRQEMGQFGLYGSAAALELMAYANAAGEFARSPRNHAHWAEYFLETWNFIDLIVRELSMIDRTSCWEQSCNILRISQLLRAVSAAHERLELFSNERLRHEAGIDERILNDLQNNVRSSIESVVIRLHQILLKARRSSDEFPEAFRVRLHGEEYTFLYAVGATGVPETWKDWLFLWGGVLVAATRAYQQKLLNEHQVGQLFTISDKGRMKEVLSRSSRYDEDRFRLFGLWALDHLSPKRYSLLSEVSFDPIIPSQLTLGPNEVAWLDKEIDRTVTNLLGSEAALRDVHSPYHVVFNPGTVGERLINDYFVIPVLPIMLDLIAQNKPEWLFRPRIHRLLRRWLDVSSNRDREQNLNVLPFQNGNYNGTVNSAYYREAALLISKVLAAKSSRAWYLVPLGALRDNSRLTFIVISAAIILSVGTTYFLFGNPSDKAVGIVLGVCLSIVTNLITPPIAKWLWSYRA